MTIRNILLVSVYTYRAVLSTLDIFLTNNADLFAKTQGVCFVEEKAFSIDFFHHFPYTCINKIRKEGKHYGF